MGLQSSEGDLALQLGPAGVEGVDLGLHGGQCAEARGKLPMVGCNRRIGRRLLAAVKPSFGLEDAFFHLLPLAPLTIAQMPSPIRGGRPAPRSALRLPRGPRAGRLVLRQPAADLPLGDRKSV